MAFCESGFAMDLYLSPTGNDANPGTRDKPVATFGAAKKLAQKVAGKEAVTIHVGDGTYFLPGTLSFSNIDSGTDKLPVTWKAENEGGAVLSGGVLREGFGRKAYNNVLVNGCFHPHVWFNNSDSSFQRNIVMGAHRNVRCAEDWQDQIDNNAYVSEDLLKVNQNFGSDGGSVGGAMQFIDLANGDFRVQRSSLGWCRLR